MVDDKVTVDLVKQARLGDKESMDALAELVRGRLYAYVYRIVLQEHLTQDIVQETMLEMFKVLGKLERADRFWPWLRAIALNKIRRHHTKLKKHRKVPISSVKEPRSKPGESQAGLASLVTEELKQVVVGAMGHLKPQHRKVLTMRCYEEMNYSDIAHLMGCTELSARVLFCRAKRALQKQLTREGFGRGFLVTALVLFGKITAPSEAAAASVSVTAATTKVGVAASLVTLASGKAAIVSLTTAGVLTVGTMVATSGVDKTGTLPGENPARSSLLTKTESLVGKGAEEGWYYFPWNVNGPVMMRLVKLDSVGTESYCQWWQDDRANYYFDKSKNTIYVNNHRMWNSELGVQRLPTDKVNFREFISMVEGRSNEMEYVSGKGQGLLVIARRGLSEDDNHLRIIHHYNVLDEEYFRYKWPWGAKVLDQRDAMHERGWTYFKVSGRLNGQKVTGTGRIPFVYALSKQNKAWLKLQVGDDLKIVDSGDEARVYGGGLVLAKYDGGSFFKGLGRPWMGLHTIDTVRRDAAQERVWFETRRMPNKAQTQVVLTCEQVKLTYTIDMKKDLIEKITFSTQEGQAGELMFSYLQEIEKANNEFAAPRRQSSVRQRENEVGMLWLVKLVNNRW